MKHAKLMLTLGALLSTAAVCADVIEDAIKDSDLDTLRIVVTVGTTHNHSFTVTRNQKAVYKALAQEQVAKCKEKCTQISVSELDVLSLVGFTAGTLSGASLIYKFFYSAKQEDRWGHGIIAIGGVLLYGVSNTIRSAKDLFKHVSEQRCKAKDALKKAEKVDKLVDSIPVEEKA